MHLRIIYSANSFFWPLAISIAMSLGCAGTKDDASQDIDSTPSDSSSTNEPSNPIVPDDARSPASVFLCQEASLPAEVLDALAAADFTRCAMPFGIVLAADDRMPQSYVQKSAQILAELMDKDMDDPQYHQPRQPLEMNYPL